MTDEVISSVKVTKLYGKSASHHALRYLTGNDYLESVPREKRREKRKFKVLKPLPTAPEIQALLNKQFTTTVDTLVEDAFGAFEELGCELRDWYDNMPENLQQGDKGCTLDEGAGVLEGLYKPDVDDRLGDLEVVFWPAVNADSRRARCEEACDMLQHAIDRLGEVEEQTHDGEDEERTDDDLHDLANDLINELEEVKSEAENVEFPGLYG